MTAFEPQKRRFEKINVSRGQEPQPSPPHFLLSGYSVNKSGEAFYLQIALVFSVWSNRNGVPCNLFCQPVTVCFLFSDLLFAEHHRHFEIHLVGVDAIFGLTNDNLATDATGEVERCQTGEYLLLCERIGFSV